MCNIRIFQSGTQVTVVLEEPFSGSPIRGSALTVHAAGRMSLTLLVASA